MKNTTIQWFLKPAKWWQFWLPQSGWSGGFILGLLLFAPVVWITV